MTLDAMPKGSNGRVISVESKDAYGLRLIEMGIVPAALATDTAASTIDAIVLAVTPVWPAGVTVPGWP